jgi:hypothetical protein
VELVAIVLGVLGAILSVLQVALDRPADSKTGETTEDRVKRLSRSLKEAVALISQIETEIKDRTALAEKLQNDVKTYNQLVQIKKPEVEAVAQLLRGELRSEGRKTFWRGVAVNFIFFVLGASASVVATMLVK